MADSGDIDFGKLVDEQVSGAAKQNVTTAQAINPQHAADALTNGPAVGVPPNLAVHTTDQVNDMAQFQKNTAILNRSPAVAQWAASDPIKAAATVKDFPNFEQVAQDASDFMERFGQRFTAGENATIAAVRKPLQDFATSIPQLKQVNKPQLFDPSSWFQKPVFREATPEEKWSSFSNTILNSLWGLGGVKIGEPVAPILNRTPEGFVKGEGTINRSNLHGVDENGHVVDEEGNVRTFDSHKEAAQWIVKEGRANPNNPQIFDVTTGQMTPTGEAPANFFVKQTGLSGLPDNPPGVEPTSDSLHVYQAQEAEAAAKAMEEKIAETQTHSNVPALMSEFLEQQMPGKSVFLDPQKVAEIYVDQGASPSAEDGILGHVPGFLEQMNNAFISGKPVEVPLSDYLTAAAGKPWADTLRQSTRFVENGVSVEESKALGEAPEVSVAKAEVPSDITPEEHDRAQALAEASRGAIIQAVKTQYLNGLFKDEKTAGMTKDQFNRYSKKVEEAVGNAYQKLVERAYNQIRRERTPVWQDRLAQNKAAVEQEMFSRPDMQALFYLRYGEHPNGAPLESPIKLDRASTLRSYGEELTNRLPDGIFGKSGAEADDVASLFGYESGDSMLREIAAIEDAARAAGIKSPREYLQKIVKAQSHVRTGDELGFDITPESIHAAASDAIASPEVADLLTDELRALGDNAGLSLDKDALSAEADRIFGELPVKAAVNIKEFERTIGIKGRLAEVALLKGKYIEAFQAKQQQLMNQLMLQRAHALTKDLARTDKKFTRWAKTPFNKNISQEYMNYVHAELMRLGYKVKRDPAELLDQIGGKKLSDFIAEKEASGAVIVHGEFGDGPIKNMTVNDYEIARDTLSSLVHNGRLEASVVILGKRMTLNDLLAEVKANGDALGRRLTPENIDRLNAIQKALKGMNAWLVAPERLLEVADRDDPMGPLNRSVVYPLQEAKGWENDKFVEITKELHEFFKAQPKDFIGSARTKLDVPELTWTNPNTGLPEVVIRTKGQLIRLALNLGNAGNRGKLLEGYNWTPDQVMGVLDKHLTKSDWDFVQKMWDLHEGLWPDIARVYRNLAGVAPKKVVATPVMTKFGEYRGGYFPISYDRLRAPEVRTMSSDSLWGEDYQSALPANPYTKGRTGYVAPINLAFEGLNKTLGQVVHDVAFREALSQANRVLTSPNVRSTIQDNFGPSYAAQLRPWLEYTARERVFDDRAGAWLENFAAAYRSNVTYVGLAYRLSSAMIHGTSALTDSVAEVGALPFATAVKDMTKSPKEMTRWMKFIEDSSAEIRHRALNMDANVREAMLHLEQKQGFVTEVQKHGYHLLALSDNLSSYPTWLAAYREAMGANGGNHDAAVLVADKSVRKAHGASAAVDLAAAQRHGHGFWGEVGKSSYGMFLSFLNHIYNRLWYIGGKYGQGASAAKAGDWAGATRDFSKASAMTIGYIIIPSVIISGIRKWLRSGNPVPDSVEDWMDGIIHTTVGGVPLAGAIVDSFEKKDRTPPIMQPIKSFTATEQDAWHKLTGHDHKVSKRWLQHAIETAGYMGAGLSGQMGATSQYLWDISTGAERAPKDFNDFMRGVVAGPKPKGKK